MLIEPSLFLANSAISIAKNAAKKVRGACMKVNLMEEVRELTVAYEEHSYDCE